MTQGMPVIAGQDNTAALTTSITADMGLASSGTAAFLVTNMTHGTGLQVTSDASETGLDVSHRTVSGTGLTVSNSSVNGGMGLSVNHTSAGMSGGIAISAFTSSPGGDALYANGQNRGLYVVGQDGEAVRAYSYNSNGTQSYGKLNGVMGVSVNPNASGVYGENNGDGFGVAGRSSGRRLRVNSGAGVWGDHTG